MLNNPRYVKSLPALFAYAHIVVVSRAMGQRLRPFGATPERMHYLPTGVPVEDFPIVARSSLQEKTRADEAVTFLQVSTFREKKGHFITLRAFKEFLPSYPHSKLIFAGEGDTLAAAQTLAAELDLGERVQFLGAVTEQEVRSLLPRADVFVHHSLTADDGDQEGTPNAILEAMSTGLPVISSQHGGIPEVIVDGENGYLVPEHDVAAYAGKMRAVLDDDGSLGARAAQTVRQSFDIRLQNAKLSQLYMDIITGEAANSDR
jgi:glycosyltransferase involved in cell wall biosynthesis